VSPTQRILSAIELALGTYRDQIDEDQNMAMLRLEVRLKPDGTVRRVLVQRESEIGD